MSLRYKFHHLFFGGKINKKRLYQVLEDLDNANGGESSDITALETVVGDENSGLVKDMASAQTDITAIETAIGDAETEGSILYRLAQLEDSQ